jgi:predicted PurR-regulated permease PerM
VTPRPERDERDERDECNERADLGVRHALLALAVLALGWIVQPLYGPILWGGVIALLFAPLHQRLCRALGQRRTLAALLTLTVALVAVLLPLAALLRALGGQAWQVYENVRSGVWQPSQLLHSTFDGLPAWLRGLLRQIGLADFATVQRRIDAGLAEASRFAGTQAFGIGQDTLGAVAGTGIALYLAFFMLRDGAALAGTLQRAMPLPPAQARTTAA